MIISETLNASKFKCSLIPFIPAGFPSLQITKHILYAFDKAGASVIELGLPYSDPLADGPIIQNASYHALGKGVDFTQVLELIQEVYPNLKAPILLFAYYNAILSRGILNFVYAIYTAGVRGLAIPDLPLEESDYIIQICSKLCIELVLFITPTSKTSRINTIIDKSPGTIYIISSLGVTGFRQDIHQNLHIFINSIRKVTNKTLITGFGISTLNHVKKVSNWGVNGIVVGSAFVKILYLQDTSILLRSIQNLCNSIITILREQPTCCIPPGEFESPLPP